jgi:hypothetical protein
MTPQLEYTHFRSPAALQVNDLSGDQRDESADICANSQLLPSGNSTSQIEFAVLNGFLAAGFRTTAKYQEIGQVGDGRSR